MSDDAGSPPPQEDGDEIITLREAADRFGVSTTELRRMARAGDLPGASTRPTPSGGVEWVVPASSAAAVAATHEGATGGGSDPFGALRTFEEPPPRRNPALIGLIVLLAGLVLAGLGVWLSGDDDPEEQAGPTSTAAEDPAAEAVDVVEAVLEEEVPDGELVGTLGSEAEDLAGRYRPTTVLPGTDAPPDVVVIAGELTEDEQAAADAIAESGELLIARDDVEPQLEIWRTGSPTATTDTTEAPETTETTEAPTSTEATTTTEAPETTTTSEATTTTEAPTTSVPPTTTTVPDDDPPVAEPPPPVEIPPTNVDGTRVVDSGESFWSIAEDIVKASSGPDATDQEIASYWLDLMELNWDDLPDPGNPDLLYVGATLRLPPSP